MAKDIEFFKSVEMLESKLDKERSLLEFSEYNSGFIAGLEEAHKILTKDRKCSCRITLKIMCSHCEKEQREQ